MFAIRKTGCFVAAFVLVVLFCIATIFIPTMRKLFMPYELQAKLVSVENDPVERVQITGKDPDADLTWSKADKNLDQGYAERTLADAEAEKLRAEACDIRNDCHAPTTPQPMSNGTVALIFTIVGVVIAFLGFAGLIKLAQTVRL